MLAPANSKGNLKFFGNCKYYQNMATLTCGSDALAGSGISGTDHFTRVSVEAKPALYWPTLLKQSDVRWLAHNIQAYMNRSQHVVIKNETQPRSLLLFCSWDRI